MLEIKGHEQNIKVDRHTSGGLNHYYIPVVVAVVDVVVVVVVVVGAVVAVEVVVGVVVAVVVGAVVVDVVVVQVVVDGALVVVILVTVGRVAGSSHEVSTTCCTTLLSCVKSDAKKK